MTNATRGLIAVLLPGLLCAGTARAAWFGSLEAGLGYDDNASRAVLSQDIRDNLDLVVAPAGGYRWVLGKNGSLALRGRLDAVLADIDALGHFDPGVAVTYRQKLRLGADAPFLEFGLGGKYQAYDSDLRTGEVVDLDAAFGMPVSELWEYKLQLGYSSRDADAEAFSQDALSFTFHNDLFLTSTGALSLVYCYRDGDITSSATRVATEPRTAALLAAATAPTVEDDAFEDENGMPLIAYRLDATTHSLRVGWNQALGSRHAIDVRYEYQFSDASDASVDYGNNLLRAAYLLRF